MSWHASFNSVEDLKNDKAAFSEVPEAGSAAREQYDAAKVSAIALVNSQSVGEASEYEFYITLSGHANPEHKPTPGWSNDCVIVNVSQKSLKM